jgi:hypothetical protein
MAWHYDVYSLQSLITSIWSLMHMVPPQVREPQISSTAGKLRASRATAVNVVVNLPLVRVLPRQRWRLAVNEKKIWRSYLLSAHQAYKPTTLSMASAIT